MSERKFQKVERQLRLRDLLAGQVNLPEAKRLSDIDLKQAVADEFKVAIRTVERDLNDIRRDGVDDSGLIRILFECPVEEWRKAYELACRINLSDEERDRIRRQADYMIFDLSAPERAIAREEQDRKQWEREGFPLIIRYNQEMATWKAQLNQLLVCVFPELFQEEHSEFQAQTREVLLARGSMAQWGEDDPRAED